FVTDLLCVPAVLAVFECAYAQLVLPWYTVPESCEQQPLHQVLSREFDFVIDRIIERAKDLSSHGTGNSDGTRTKGKGKVPVLVLLLSFRQLLFMSRAKEIAVLRELSDALVCNLFPKSLWGQEVNRCALNEIIALKGKEALNHLCSNKICKLDSTSLPGVLVLEEMEVNDKVKEEARVSVEHFLQELVSDNLIGHTQPVFQFLCPLDKLLNEEKHGGVWGLLSGLAYFLTPSYEEDENSSIQPGAPDENTMSSLQLESTAQSLENHSASDVPSQTLPSIVISQYDSPLELPEETDINPQPSVDSKSSNENGSQEKNEDSDNPLTSHFKTLFKGFGRYRSHESLASKNGSEEDVSDSGLQREGPEGSTENYKDDTNTLISLTGNSFLINIFDTVLKPFMPILKKKVNSFLRKVNPTQAQMASYIDNLRSKLWPESPPPTPHPPRTDEEKDKTRDRAHNLINAKYSNVLFLKKTDMESVFNLFQDREENKTLVYMLLSFLLREFLPSEFSLNASAAVLQ
ncbi:uncharacterized protein si:rp71-46j2.7, partial [Neolamprologus brichardi]|uniref:uncharacterized protein si:rp71-46j2.7 n=1 Tax=Neolamprologus brichardi TaxID=32507 RepID=UPI001643A805